MPFRALDTERSICRFCIAAFLATSSVIGGGHVQRAVSNQPHLDTEGTHVAYKISLRFCYFNSTCRRYNSGRGGEDRRRCGTCRMFPEGQRSCGRRWFQRDWRRQECYGARCLSPVLLQGGHSAIKTGKQEDCLQAVLYRRPTFNGPDLAPGHVSAGSAELSTCVSSELSMAIPTKTCGSVCIERTKGFLLSTDAPRGGAA